MLVYDIIKLCLVFIVLIERPLVVGITYFSVFFSATFYFLSTQSDFISVTFNFIIFYDPQSELINLYGTCLPSDVFLLLLSVVHV